MMMLPVAARALASSASVNVLTGDKIDTPLARQSTAYELPRDMQVVAEAERPIRPRNLFPRYHARQVRFLASWRDGPMGGHRRHDE